MNKRDTPDTQTPRHDLPEPGDPNYRDTRPENVMGQHHAITGGARGVGSTAYDDPGAFDVGAGAAADDAGTSDRSEPRSFTAHDAASGPLETGTEFRTEAQVADRDVGDGAVRLSPENARPEGEDAEAALHWGKSLTQPETDFTHEQADARRMHGEAASATDAHDAPRPDETRGGGFGARDNADGI